MLIILIQYLTIQANRQLHTQKVNKFRSAPHVAVGVVGGCLITTGFFTIIQKQNKESLIEVNDQKYSILDRENHLNQLQNLEESKQDLEKRLEEMTHRQKEYNDTMQPEMAAKDRKISDLEKKLMEMKHNMIQMASNITNQKATLEAKDKKIKEQQSKIKATTIKLTQKERQIATLNKEMRNLYNIDKYLNVKTKHSLALQNRIESLEGTLEIEQSTFKEQLEWLKGQDNVTNIQTIIDSILESN